MRTLRALVPHLIVVVAALICAGLVSLVAISAACAGSPTTAAQSTQPPTNSHGTQTNIVPPDVAQLLIDAAKDPGLSSEFLIAVWSEAAIQQYLDAYQMLGVAFENVHIVFTSYSVESNGDNEGGSDPDHDVCQRLRPDHGCPSDRSGPGPARPVTVARLGTMIVHSSPQPLASHCFSVVMPWQ